jgi:hypothetical protein
MAAAISAVRIGAGHRLADALQQDQSQAAGDDLFVVGHQFEVARRAEGRGRAPAGRRRSK